MVRQRPHSATDRKRGALPTDTRLPDRSEHWNYLTSASASLDGKLVLVGSEAGSSTSHFEDYWLSIEPPGRRYATARRRCSVRMDALPRSRASSSDRRSTRTA